MFFAIFVIVLAAIAALSVADSRAHSTETLPRALHHAGRRVSSVEMSRQAQIALPLR